MRIGSMATIASRRDILHHAVESIAPQLDHVHIYANDYRPVLQGANVSVSYAPVGDLGDRGKWFLPWEPHAEDIRYLLDDDLLYGEQYARLLAHHLTAAPHAIVGVHGIVLRHPVRSYYRDRQVLHFRRALQTMQQVDLLGSGCLAFRHATLSHLMLEQFTHPNMLDVWLGCLCRHDRIPLLCIPRPADLIQQVPVADAIFDWAYHDDAQQTRLIRTTWGDA